MSTIIDVFLVEDDLDFRTTIEDCLYQNKISFKSFDNIEDARDQIEEGKIGCVITDVFFSTGNGIDFMKGLLEKDPYLPVIVMTGYSSIDLALKAIKSGAREYIEKPFKINDFMKILKQVLKISTIEKEKREREIRIIKNVGSLTAREKEILKLLSLGQTNKEIGLILNISYRTVEVHRANIVDKLGAKTLIDLVYVSDRLNQLEKN